MEPSKADSHQSKTDGTSVTPNHDHETGEVQVHDSGQLRRDLKSRHMQMIAIGGAIGAGLFIGSGSALRRGGPAALVLGYGIVGIMLFCTALALAEMAVLFPINGAFYTYIVRFVDPSWGFAMGWEYALAWLTVLPFELVAASITIEYWRDDINMGVWVTLFLVLLTLIQIFGVRGYGEVEFVLSSIKIMACLGFIILGIIINTGGVGDQGYIGTKYWHDPGAFKNSFNGFSSVFTVAAFGFGGTELVGLAAAESKNPSKAIPRASKQVFWRIAIFYILNLLMVGLILSSDDPRLEGSSGANSKASPFVLAIQDAGIKVLPSIFNAIITVSVISAANSCTYGSTRTMQAMAEHGDAPKILSYVDNRGRPLWCISVQLAVGLLAYIGVSGESGVIFDWLLALSGLAFVFVWGSICLAHIRMRAGWKYQGLPLNRIPYRTPFGLIGSYVGFVLNVIVLIATFYSALYPTPDATPHPDAFFKSYLAMPVTILLYLGHKIYNRNWRLYVPVDKMDLLTHVKMLHEDEITEKKPITWTNFPRKLWETLF